MKSQIAIKSFLFILSFLTLILLTLFFTRIYFDFKYLTSPTFNLIKWTAVNIILCHSIFIVALITLLLYKGKFLGRIYFYTKLITLILITISLVFKVVYFYDFLL
jgi:hypothetical protein